MKFSEWPRGPVILLILAILMFVLPDEWGGPSLLGNGNGHYISLVETLAIVPLMISGIWIQKGLWARRIYLFNKITMYPGSASLLIFFIGAGLGMLIASAFSGFHYWWLAGSLIFVILLMYIVLISGKSP